MHPRRLSDPEIDTADLSEPARDDAWEIADRIDRLLRVVESAIEDHLPPSEAGLAELLIAVDR